MKRISVEECEVVRVIVNKMEGVILEFIFLTFALGHYTGTGDCTAALLLAWTHLTNQDISQSLVNTLTTLQSLLKLTQQIQQTHVINSTDFLN
jgi:pyridoxal/pyridoxine/pyridoxamine kinase